jgi:tetratricopeptide (TPR) repeat protein
MTTRRDPLAESFRAALDAETPASASDDDALLARAVDRTMAGALALAAPSPVAEAPAAGAAAPGAPATVRDLRSSRRARGRALRYALPAAAALVASVAMAAVYMGYAGKAPPEHDVTHSSRGEVAPPSGASPATPPAPVANPALEGAPSFSVDDLPTAGAVGAPAPHHAGGAGAATATAAELFRDANASRRAGELDKAVSLYGALVAGHADTPEALAARVSLGRLLLDRRGDAAGALVQFDAYLKSPSSDGALAEEARLGRALVFQRQGSHVEERRAWHELLEKHPDSLYAARARERLRALAPAELAPAISSPVP